MNSTGPTRAVDGVQVSATACTVRGLLLALVCVSLPLSTPAARALGTGRNWDGSGQNWDGSARLGGLHAGTHFGRRAAHEGGPLGGALGSYPAAGALLPPGFGPLDPTPPSGITPEQIIAKFGEREAAFAKARDQYTFRQTVKVQTVDDDTGQPDGTYFQVTDIVFGDDGRRSEHVVAAPANTIERVMMTEADFDDIQHRLPFVLTTPELPEYQLTYLGRQRVDDIDTYVFDCKPRTLEKGKRYFLGKVWVDQQQLQIVLINGKAVPDILRRGHEDLSPPYTTYYAEVDGGSWFPVYTRADGVLHFPGDGGAIANDVHIRYTVKYEDYKRFHAKSRIIYNGQDLPAQTDAQPGAPAGTPDAGTPPASDPNALPPADPNAPPLTRTKPKH